MNPTTALPSAPSIISAVVAPAILILACSSLITTTANRLSLLLDRVRELTKEMESLRAKPLDAADSKRAYVVNPALKMVSAIDTKTLKVLANVQVGEGPRNVSTLVMP